MGRESSYFFGIFQDGPYDLFSEILKKPLYFWSRMADNRYMNTNTTTITPEMVGMAVVAECSGCNGTGFHAAWANHQPKGRTSCYLCGGTDGTYRVDRDGNHVSGQRCAGGRGWNVTTIGEWMVGGTLPRGFRLSTFA